MSLAGVAARVVAVRVLDAVVHRGRSLKAELAQALPALADPRDRALAEAICFAALRQRHRYQAVLRDWLRKPLGPRDGELGALLLAGFAQIDALALPAHAALSATVEAVRTLGRPHQAGMVNALLRRAQREGVAAADPALAWPAWLRAQVEADWAQQASAIFSASAQPAPLWLRVNRRRLARDDYRSRLEQAGLASTIDARWPDAVRLDLPVAATTLPGFAAGDVSVQDAAAQGVADALALPPGARVLDACAAPGGKAAHLLERDPSLRLTALDIDMRRLRQVHATLERLGLAEGVVLKAADASDLGAWWDGQPFDAVLLDAPCSATGIVRRQPDILLHRRETDLAALLDTQARLLDALWCTLRPGGTMVYATCSILKQENERQVERFLKRTPDAVVEPLGDAFGHDRNAARQRLPGEYGADGFFYARLGKTC